MLGLQVRQRIRSTAKLCRMKRRYHRAAMSRRGAEAKPAWRRVPRLVRRLTEDQLGAPVARATRVYGGYAPSATFRLLLAGGKRAFFKASYPIGDKCVGLSRARSCS